MAYDEGLAERIREAFDGRSDVTEKKMFGGLAFLCDGRMCCSINGSDLMVRVTEDEIEAVMRRPHVRPMDFTGRPLRGFVYVSADGYQKAADLQAWIDGGLRFVASGEVGRKARSRGRRGAIPIAPSARQRGWGASANLPRASFSNAMRAVRASSGVLTGVGKARRMGRGPSPVVAENSKPYRSMPVMLAALASVAFEKALQ